MPVGTGTVSNTGAAGLNVKSAASPKTKSKQSPVLDRQKLDQTKFCANCLEGGHSVCDETPKQFAFVFKGHPDLVEVASFPMLGTMLVQPRQVKDFTFALVMAGQIIAPFSEWRELRSIVRVAVSEMLEKLMERSPPEDLRLKMEVASQALLEVYAKADNMTVCLQKGLYALLREAYENLRAEVSGDLMRPDDSLTPQDVWDWATLHKDAMLSEYRILQAFCDNNLSQAWKGKLATLQRKCSVLMEEIKEYADHPHRKEVFKESPTFKLMFEQVGLSVPIIKADDENYLQAINYFLPDITRVPKRLAKSLAAEVKLTKS